MGRKEQDAVDRNHYTEIQLIVKPSQGSNQAVTIRCEPGAKVAVYDIEITPDIVMKNHAVEDMGEIIKSDIYQIYGVDVILSLIDSADIFREIDRRVRHLGQSVKVTCKCESRK